MNENRQILFKNDKKSSVFFTEELKKAFELQKNSL